MPVAFRASPLPSDFSGTPQDLLDAFVDRLSMETEEDLALYVAGSVMPTSDSGPWLKDNLTWWVWDVDNGQYIPQPLERASLRYIIQESEPDSDDYDVWIQTDSSGKAIAIKTYSSGAWHDIYEDKFTEIDEQIGTVTNTYPVSAETGGSQQVEVDAPDDSVMQIDTINFDPSGKFDTATFRYTAAVAGYYHIESECQVDNYTADGSVEISYLIFKNGFPTPVSSGTSVSGPPGQRWYPAVSGLLQLAANDYIDVRISVHDDDYAGGFVSASNGTFNVFKVQSI